jgi:hypothetical protein
VKDKGIKISNYVKVKKKAQDLGCNVPDSIALLPRNFEFAKSKDELIHESTTATVRTLWRQNDIVETPLEKSGEKFPFIAQEAFEWIAPTIFVTATLISQNPALVTLALNVISNYLTDWFRGITQDKRKVKLRIIVENKHKSCKKIDYEGPQEGLKELHKVIKSVYEEN